MLAHYLAEEISLGRAAELLDLPWIDLRTRFLRLDVPLRIGPADPDEARAEVANLAAQEPESEGYDVSDHVAALAVHGLTPDAVLYDPDRLAGVDGVSTAVGEQLTEANPWVHDAERLAEALAGLAGVPLWSEREQAAND